MRDTDEELKGVGEADGVEQGHGVDVWQRRVDIGHGADEAYHQSLYEVEIAEKQEFLPTRLRSCFLLLLCGSGQDIYVCLDGGAPNFLITHIIDQSKQR